MNKAPYIEFIDERTLKLIIRRQQLTEIGLRPARIMYGMTLTKSKTLCNATNLITLSSM